MPAGLVEEPAQLFTGALGGSEESARRLLVDPKGEPFERFVGLIQRQLLVHQQLGVIATFSGADFEIELHEILLSC